MVSNTVRAYWKQKIQLQLDATIGDRKDTQFLVHPTCDLDDTNIKYHGRLVTNSNAQLLIKCKHTFISSFELTKEFLLSEFFCLVFSF